jgi:hypothetical protein
VLRWGIVAESRGDAEFVCALGDAVVVDVADWVASQPEAFRQWCGLGNAEFLDLHAATELARKRGVRISGHFQDGPGKLDAQLYRNIFALFADEDEPPSIVVISQDTDEDRERLLGFQQAASDRTWGFAAVHAAAHPEHEGWLLAAFVPQNDRESASLEDLKRELGFDPTADADDLKAGVETAKRNAKRILAMVTTVEEGRERLLATPIRVLEERGQPSGLSAFLNDFRQVVAPSLGAHLG